jgi:hypothetical protein
MDGRFEDEVSSTVFRAALAVDMRSRLQARVRGRRNWLSAIFDEMPGSRPEADTALDELLADESLERLAVPDEVFPGAV